jgi:small nuclear ribonucleoprotein (snRNP)-like protein
VLTDSVKNNTQVLINCRNNKKLLGRVKAFDRLVLNICSVADPESGAFLTPGSVIHDGKKSGSLMNIFLRA